jgi:predicted nucleotidyltransferase component of viral defense system
MIAPEYKVQVDLLLTILPHVAKEESLALKGGTAINLFVRDMPRLSVDIDLTYINREHNREQALQNISEALDRIQSRIKDAIPQISVTRIPQQGQDVKLNCQTPRATIKIEVNTVTRGILFPERLLSIADTVQNEFQKFAAIKVVSHAELYGGKICASLDRQHPRDLFDVHLMFANEGFINEIKAGFLLFLLSHYRPIHEVLSPNLQDQREAFQNQFAGMSAIPFTYEQFEATRLQLVTEVNKSLTDTDKQFLISFKKGEPDWSLAPIENLHAFPAVQWKLLNIQNLASGNKIKHAEMINALESTLSN